MRSNSKFLIVIGVLLVAGYVSCTGGNTTEEKKEEKTLTAEEKVKRGEYLVSIIGCDDCHSPKKWVLMGQK